MVGKMGKVGGKGEIYTGGSGLGKIYTKFYWRYTPSFAWGFPHFFHYGGKVMEKVGDKFSSGASHRFSPGFLQFGRGEGNLT